MNPADLPLEIRKRINRYVYRRFAQIILTNDGEKFAYGTGYFVSRNNKIFLITCEHGLKYQAAGVIINSPHKLLNLADFKLEFSDKTLDVAIFSHPNIKAQAFQIDDFIGYNHLSMENLIEDRYFLFFGYPGSLIYDDKVRSYYFWTQDEFAHDCITDKNLIAFKYWFKQRKNKKDKKPSCHVGGMSGTLVLLPDFNVEKFKVKDIKFKVVGLMNSWNEGNTLYATKANLIRDAWLSACPNPPLV